MGTNELIAISLALFGAWLAWTDRRAFFTALRSYRWPSANGTIKELNDVSFFIDGHSHLQPEVSSVKYTETQNVYEFQVDGVLYRGNRFGFGGHLDQVGTDFHTGDKVTVFYSPLNPANCVLKRGVGLGTIFGYLVILVAMVFFAYWKGR